ncbi:MAG: WYL domain-containing protein [Paludibacteraceae bacterium]|nr:WYL domain-containing protein [Paludibacteraceae bacterium]
MIYDDIQKAIDTGAIIEIEYTKNDGTASVRHLSDVKYSDEFGNTHIQAFCHKRNEQRTFKISRISRVTFINTPNIITPTKKTPYRFDRSKRIFKLYNHDIDHNN